MFCKGVSSESCSAADCHAVGKIGKKDAVRDLHDKAKGQDCLLCHTDHRGLKGKITIPFDHKALPETVKCADCHKGPGDDLHEKAGQDCRSCHTTKAWKPSTYDHDRYFPLVKDHNVGCNKCHDGGVYKKYTCMNCHVHATGGIISEHREEGIRDFGDCLRCHRITINGRSYGTGKVDDSMIDDEGHRGGKGGRYGRDDDDDDD